MNALVNNNFNISSQQEQNIATSSEAWLTQHFQVGTAQKRNGVGSSSGGGYQLKHDNNSTLKSSIPEKLGSFEVSYHRPRTKKQNYTSAIRRSKTPKRKRPILPMDAVLFANAEDVIVEENEISIYPNTYELESSNPFDILKAREIVKMELDRAINSSDKIPTQDQCKIISERIKCRLKSLQFDRYRYIVSIVCGDNRNQGLRVSSRFLWDEEKDNYVSETLSFKTFFVVCNVYAVYFE